MAKKSKKKAIKKKKVTSKKAATKKKSAKKAPAAKKAKGKKVATKKTATKKTAAKKTAGKKATAKKPAKKASSPKAKPKKATKKKPAAKKTATAKAPVESKAAANPMPKEGEMAPEFTLNNDRGESVSLSNFRGSKNVVIYFYPKDDTPGCTKEACNFRDDLHAILARDAVVFGISPDSVESHVRFRDKYNLNFELLADTDHAVAEKYGAWTLKNMYGKTSWGIQRSTFLINKEGQIVKTWPRVSVEEHSREVQAALNTLS